MFRYRLVENYAYDKVKLVIGQTSVEAKVPPHRLFSQVKSIQLKNDEFNLKCLQLMQKGEIEITAEKSAEFVRRCKQAFNIQLQLNLTEIGIDFLVSNSDQDITKLDLLQFTDLMSVIKIAFDKTPTKFHAKVIRKIKSYLTSSKRKQDQKDNLDKLLKWYRDNQKNEDLEDGEQKYEAPVKKVQKIQKINRQPTKFVKKQSEKLQVRPQKRNNDDNISEDSNERIQEELAEQIKPAQKYQRRSKRESRQGNNWQQQPDQDEKKNGRGRDNRMRQNRSKGGRSNDRFGGGSMSKEKRFDPKITLGISGDTEAGWRQRYRPPRVPAGNTLSVDQPNDYKPQTNNLNLQHKYSSKSNYDKQERNQIQKPVAESKPKQVNIQMPKVDVKPTQSSPSKQNKDLIFTYPIDGSDFDFNSVKKSFRLFINGSFWVNYSNGSLQIKKGDKGYIRQSKIDVIKNGFMAEGLTIRLGDSSNIEDGGDAFGGPTIQDFTNTPSQFFHVITLEIFKYESTNLPTASNNGAKKLITEELKKPAPIQKVQQQTQNQPIQKTPKKEDKKQQKQKNVVSSKSKEQKPSDNQQDWQDEDGEVQGQSQDGSPKVQPKKDSAPPRRQKQVNKTHENRVKPHESKESKNNLRVEQNKNTKSRSKSKQGRSHSKSSRQQNQRNSKEKQIDPEILLGIKGDTQLGWRERNRPSHSPGRDNSQQDGKEQGQSQNGPNSRPSNQNQQKDKAKLVPKQKSQKISTQNGHKPQQREQKLSASQNKRDQKLLFAYPKDGKQFDFNKIKSGFKMLVNNKFWIHYENGKLEIKKGQNGYSRESNLDVMENGFMAHGLTIHLDGISNIEDGGDELGSPSIEDFTENKSQFFSVNELQVFKL